MTGYRPHRALPLPPLFGLLSEGSRGSAERMGIRRQVGDGDGGRPENPARFGGISRLLLPLPAEMEAETNGKRPGAEIRGKAAAKSGRAQGTRLADDENAQPHARRPRVDARYGADGVRQWDGEDDRVPARGGAGIYPGWIQSS